MALLLFACGDQSPGHDGIDQASLIPPTAAIHKCADQLQFVELGWSAARLMRYREWAPQSAVGRNLADPEIPIWVVALEGTWLMSRGRIVDGHGLCALEAPTGIILERRAEQGAGHLAGWDELPDHQRR